MTRIPVSARLSTEGDGVEMNRSVIDTTECGEFQHDHLGRLMDELVCVRWDVIHRLRGSADVPAILAAHLRRVDDELDMAIKTLGAHIREQQFPE